MKSKQRMVDLLNELTDVANTYRIGTATHLSGYIESLRRAIHKASAEEVNDPYATPATHKYELGMPDVIAEQVRSVVRTLDDQMHASGLLPPGMHLEWQG